MNILVINSGSSSLKYQLINMTNESVLAKGLCERIGINNSFLKHSKAGASAVVIEKDLYNHKIAIEEVIKTLTDPVIGVIKNMSDINAIGHRVVHGGEKFKSSVVIDDSVMAAIKSCIDIAPLHNPPNITGIKACQQIMPGIPQVAVFDTAFHQTMPKNAYLYALPYEYYEKYSVRKYGFHGTSHKYVAQRAAIMLNTPISETKIITCHLGNGGSICAIKNGKSVDTSMGFTPLDGLVMGTRSGTVDAAAILFLMEKEGLSCKDANDMLNKKSGLLGISGISSDMRDILEKADQGDKRAKLAIDMFIYRVKTFIGQYIAIMNGVDAIVFTAGVGENNSALRAAICNDFDFFGIALDEEKNSRRGEEFEISKDVSKVKVFVIATNEELSIARETLELTK